MKKYVLLIKLLDVKHSTVDNKMYRTWTRFFDSYRELRDYLVKYNFYDDEYTVYEETNIKIKNISLNTNIK